METMQPLDARKEFLAFTLAGEEYAIDILQVREIRAHETPTRIANAPAHVKGVISLRGAIVPIVDLRVRFGLGEPAEGASRVVIILRLAERPLGIVVDAVSQVVALGAGDIRATPEEVRTGVAESFVRGLAPVEGRMLIVVDLMQLLAAGVAAEAA